MEIRRRPPNPKIRVANLEYAIPHKDSSSKNILEEIIWFKEKEIDIFKKSISLKDLQKNIALLPPTRGFKNFLANSNNKPSIIAEIKKASPSKGIIREDFDPESIAKIYQDNGASCISVLTDKKFFQGGFHILKKISEITELPLLCKDFIISPYQIFKARACGADAILLIAAVLSLQDLVYLTKVARSINLDVLVEVHNKEELKNVLKIEDIDMIGINNRDLKTFITDLNVTLNLSKVFSESEFSVGKILVSESGIKNYDDIIFLRNHGIRSVLIGESLMKSKDIAKSLKELIEK